MSDTGLSAYLSIFDDWDALPQVLAAIDRYVDEIVVVDGAYKWIAPHLGDRDPTRSRAEVLDALSPYSGKMRIIHDTWDDEFQKRQAGFAACSNRYVFRFDADEVNFFDDAALERFFASDYAVAQIDMPTFVTPDFYHKESEQGSRQSALFDSRQVDARHHLDWLWLVLPSYLQQNETDPAMLFPEPVSFTPHLTHWRHPFSASNRALFYVLLWIKNHRSEAALAQIPADIRTRLLGRDIVAGGPFPIHGSIAPSPLEGAERAVIEEIYRAHMTALTELNLGLRDGRVINDGELYNIDVTTEAQAAALGTVFSFPSPILTFEAKLTAVRSSAPYVVEQPVPFSVQGTEARLTLPAPAPDDLRRTLTVLPRTAPHPALTMRTEG